jgi:DNA-binding CsgD family transcriptional regulator
MEPMTGLLDGGPDAERPAPGSLLIPCPVLVGRASESDTLSRRLDDAFAGRGSAVFVLGEAGIGKSRLVHEVSSMAAARGARVLRGRAVPGSAGAAFRPLTEALAPLAVEVEADADLAPWLPALSAILPTTPASAALELTTPLRGEAVIRLLQWRAAPGLLVLEDLHWADPETVGVVEHLSDHLGRVGVLCVVTVRSDEPSAARDMARRVASRRTCPVVELGRLNDAQVAAMAHSCTGGSSADAIERVIALAEGVPFLVEEMLASPGLPPSFAAGVEARLAQLGEHDRLVLVAAAAFGRHFDWHLLGTVTGLPDSDVVGALERGVSTQLLAVEGDGFRFRHALTAEAVFQSVIPPRREALAAAALDALDAAGDELPAERRDVAARLAERAGRRERAGHLHLALGDEALGRSALDTAAIALERAAGLLPSGDARDATLERLVEALALGGRVDDALAAGDELVARLPAERAASVHLRLAGAAATASRWTVARQHLDAAGRLVGGVGSPPLQADLAIAAAEIALGTHDVGGAEHQARRALDVARADGLAEQECAALQLLGRCARRSSLEEAGGWFRELLDAAKTHRSAIWRLRALHELGTIALLERSAIDDLLVAQQLAESLGAMATAAVLDIEIAAGAAGHDDYDRGLHHAEQAVRRGTELGMDVIVAYGWMHVASFWTLKGDRERAAAAQAAARAAAPGDRDVEGLLIGLQLLGALAEDDLDRALELATRFTEQLRGSETAPPAHHRAAWPLLLAMSGRPEAEAAIEEICRTNVVVHSAGRAGLTMARAIQAGRSDPERAVALAVEADGLLGNLPLWQSVVRRLVAEAAAADGWPIPDHWLPEAEQCLRGLGHPGAADACRRLRGAAPSPVPAAWARLGVTRREAEVLALVVEGSSNRDIAEQLYLSVRTVEKHVESLLRKTGSRSRTQLAAVARTT